MLSATNLTALDDAGLTFIAGSRATRAPIDLASHFRWHGDAFTDGQLIDTITPKTPAPSRTTRPSVPSRSGTGASIRARGGRCGPTPPSAQSGITNTLTIQENRAREVISGAKKAKTTRFVKTSGDQKVLDETSLARARRLVGLKGMSPTSPPT